MRSLVLIAAMAAAFPVAAEPLDDPQRAQAAWIQAEQARRLERATQQCELHRGVDCQTAAGLQEWLLNDRSRADAVLDRIAPITIAPPPVTQGGASAGSSAPQR